MRSIWLFILRQIFSVFLLILVFQKSNFISGLRFYIRSSYLNKYFIAFFCGSKQGCCSNVDGLNQHYHFDEREEGAPNKLKSLLRSSFGLRVQKRPNPSRETVPLRKGRLELTDSQIIELVLVTIHM
jgi:hypothetical protein